MADTVKSTSDATKHGQIVLNPDGSNVGAASVDGGSFAAGTTTGNVIQGIYETSPTTLAAGKVGALRADVNRNLVTSLGTALSKTVDSVTSRPEGCNYINFTADTTVRTGSGILVGMYVNSTSSGTIVFYDNTVASGTKIFNTITPAVGWHPLGNAAFSTGCFADISNTIDVTVIYIPT